MSFFKIFNIFAYLFHILSHELVRQSIRQFPAGQALARPLYPWFMPSVPQIIFYSPGLKLSRVRLARLLSFILCTLKRGMNCGWMELIVAMVGPVILMRGFCRVPARPSSCAWSRRPWTRPSRTEEGKIKPDRAGFMRIDLLKDSIRAGKRCWRRRVLARAWRERYHNTFWFVSDIFFNFKWHKIIVHKLHLK